MQIGAQMKTVHLKIERLKCKLRWSGTFFWVFNNCGKLQHCNANWDVRRDCRTLPRSATAAASPAEAAAIPSTLTTTDDDDESMSIEQRRFPESNFPVFHNALVPVFHTISLYNSIISCGCFSSLFAFPFLFLLPVRCFASFLLAAGFATYRHTLYLNIWNN